MNLTFFVSQVMKGSWWMINQLQQLYAVNVNHHWIVHEYQILTSQTWQPHTSTKKKVHTISKFILMVLPINYRNISFFWICYDTSLTCSGRCFSHLIFRKSLDLFERSFKPTSPNLLFFFYRKTNLSPSIKDYVSNFLS